MISSAPEQNTTTQVDEETIIKPREEHSNRLPGLRDSRFR